jgi:capsular exopolysaccharide synthesis family protein
MYAPASILASRYMAIEPLPSDDTVSLGEYLGVLRRRKWSIVVLTLFATLGGLVYARQQTPLYQSTSRVLATVPFSQAQAAALAPNMETESSFVTSDSVTKCTSLIMNDTQFRTNPLAGPILSLDSLCSPDILNQTVLDRSLQLSVTVTIIQAANVMTISFEDAHPIRAQGGAQAFALAYTHIRTQGGIDLVNQLAAGPLATQKTLEDAIAKLNSSINKAIADQQQAEADAIAAGLPPPNNTVEILNLESERNSKESQLQDINNELRTLDPSRINPAQVLLPAGLPQKAVSPNIPLLGGLGFLGGIALGVALAFLRERLDDSLRGRADLEQNLGAPVLAVIPKVPGWRNKHDARLVAREQPKSAVAEAYRTLRTSISFASAQRGLKVIMVCSPAAGEGKTTTAANLALVLADAGKRVVLVSSDLRKPRLHRFFGLQNDVGLSSVLAGEKQPWEAILDPGVENLRVLLSGPVPSRPAELLQSEQMGEVLTGLREVADFVIIDTAPILLVADALALAPLVDGVLFVADSERTSRSAVAHAREQLDQVGAAIIGSVLNNFDPAKARAYRYYGYYSPYRSAYGGRYGYGTYAYGSSTSENGEGRRGEPPVLEAPQERRGP